MEKDLGSLTYNDFEYGKWLPPYLKFINEHKPSWLNMFESMFPKNDKSHQA